VLGASFIKFYHVVFDWEGKRLGFFPKTDIGQFILNNLNEAGIQSDSDFNKGIIVVFGLILGLCVLIPLCILMKCKREDNTK